jgi:large subunit ribosomal protein L15
MTDTLSHLSPPPGAVRTAKRVGRGGGSRLGTTCGRGEKGQKARRTGNLGKLHFQGGQTPMQRRLPKRGFNRPYPTPTAVVNVSDLERFAAGSVVDEAALRAARLVQGRDVRIKILGEGELTKSLKISAHAFSKTATAKIEKAGGSVTVLLAPGAPTPESAT